MLIKKDVKTKKGLWLRNIINAFFIVIVIRFISTVIGFGFQQALFGGKFSFPWDTFGLWVLIHTLSCVLAYYLFHGKERTNKEFNFATAFLDIVLLVIILVVAFMYAWSL